MDLTLNEEQQELESMLHDILAQRSGSSDVRATVASGEPFDRALWAVLCEQVGVASLAIPEEFGGAGFSTRETHVVLEALGRSLTPSPFLGSVAIAAQAVLASGDAAACAEVLPLIASGERIATLCWAAPSGAWRPEDVAVTATRTGEGWQLTGTVPFVLDATAADTVLAIAQTPSGPGLFLIAEPATLRREATPSLDQTITLGTIHFEAVDAELLSCDATALEQIRLHAITALSATQVGTAARALADTVEYSKQRVQFGRQIGSFQALKHRMADMHVELEKARVTSAAAAWAAATGADEWTELATLAKACVSDALTHIAGEMVQLHGGIAITWEHDAQLVFKRAHATAQLFGSPTEHRARRADALAL